MGVPALARSSRRGAPGSAFASASALVSSFANEVCRLPRLRWLASPPSASLTPLRSWKKQKKFKKN